MKSFKGDKHQKDGKNDGVKPPERIRKRDEKNPPKFENFNGEPIE